MPPSQFARANGITLAYHEAGPASDAPPLLLCHGWPELAFSWRRQIAALSAAGWRVIAPDMRGFGASEAPSEVDAYDLRHLTGDMAGLLDHLGVARAIFVGHDWGGALVWRMAQEHPQRVAGVIALNTPHPAQAPIDPIEIFRKRFGEDFYIVQFQQPGNAPDRLFAEHVEQTFDFLMRRPPPRESGERPNLALPQLAASYDAARDARPRFLTDEERAVYVETYRGAGFTGGINWYRNITRNWRRGAELSETISRPCLMLMAERDVVLPPSACEGMEARVPDLEKVLIRDCGHWTMQEKPEETNAAMLDWLERRMRARG